MRTKATYKNLNNLVLNKILIVIWYLIFTYFFIVYDSPYKPFGSPWFLALGASFTMMICAIHQNTFLDRRLAYLLLLVLLPILYKFLQIFFIPSISEHWNATIIYSSVCLISVGVAYFTFIFTRHTELYFIIMSIWLCTNLVFLVIHIFLGLSSGNADILGFSGLLNDRNNFAIQTVFLLVLSDFTTRFRKMQVLHIFICSIFIFFSGSLTALSIIFIFIFYKFFQLPNQTKIHISCLMFFILYYFRSDIRNLLETTLNRINNVYAMLSGASISDGSTSTRIWLLEKGWELLSENILFGIGLNNTSKYISYSREKGTDGINTHNNFLEILVTSGLVGFILHYSLILSVLVMLKTNKNKNKIRLLLSLYLVTGLGYVTDNHYITVYAYIAAFALYFEGMKPRLNLRKL